MPSTWWENATGCHLLWAADVNFFIRRRVLWTLCSESREFLKDIAIVLVFFRTTKPTTVLCSRKKRFVYSLESYMSSQMVCWHPQTHSPLDSKEKTLLPWAELHSVPIMNPFTTMSSGILCQTSIIYFENPSKSWARKQWLFLKRLNLLNSVLTDGKAKNVYTRPHEI